MEQGKEMKRYCTGLGNFDICFCLICDRYCLRFISKREDRL